MAPTSTSLAIIAGVGPGTGASVARKFAETYPVVLLARNPDNYVHLVAEIEAAGGIATGISTDVSSAASVEAAFTKIKALAGEGKETKVAAGIFNVGGSFVRKPFLELSEADFSGSWNANSLGAFHFSKSILPLLLATTPSPDTPIPTTTPPTHSPTLLFTGATASLRGGALFASVAAAKFALRAVSQSLAREFGPKGVHVAHVVVDGIIDIERTKGWGVPGVDAKIGPGAIAEQYWYLHTQPRSMWTQELDIRPWVEKF